MSDWQAHFPSEAESLETCVQMNENNDILKIVEAERKSVFDGLKYCDLKVGDLW
jgi:hypothetical protein